MDEGVETALLTMRAHQLRGHHRGQGQGDEGGQRDRGRQGHRELAEQTAGVAFHETDRQEYRDQHGRGRDHGEGDLARAALGRDQGRLAEIGATLDVLEHDDRIVDDEADAENQGEQGQQVDRVAECIESDKGGDQADRHGHGRNQGRTRAAEEQEDHQHDQHAAFDQGCIDALDRRLDEQGRVIGDEDLGALGQGLLHALGFGARSAGDIEAVGGGGLDDAETDIRLAVAAQVGAALFGGAFDLRHVAEAHDIAVAALGQGELGEIVGFGVIALHAQGEIAALRFDATGRQFDILAPQRRFDVRNGEAARRQGLAVEPDAHRVALSAADVDTRHAFDRRQAVGHVALGIVAQFERIHAIGAHVEPEYGIGVALDLRHLGRIGFFGESVLDATDRIAHVVGSGFYVAAQVEFHRYVGAAIATARLDHVDAFDAGQRILEDLGDARLDHGRRGTGIVHLDRNHRRIDGRQLAQGQPRERHDAEHDQQQADHGRKDRAAYRNVGEVHEDASFGVPASLIFEPSRSLTVPSTTMRVPATMPSTISTWPDWRAPSVTLTRSTVSSSATR